MSVTDPSDKEIFHVTVGDSELFRFSCLHGPVFVFYGIKPGLHERHKHEEKIITKTKQNDIFSGTCKDKTTRIFLCFIFCSTLGICLDYDLLLMLTTVLMLQA